jgi:hypothetical protein
MILVHIIWESLLSSGRDPYKTKIFLDIHKKYLYINLVVQYLIKFNYRCDSELFSICKKTLLVNAENFKEACDKIKLQDDYQDAKGFENLTLE